ncbi:MAG: haloacid dehalogenase [Candidatus Bathyarchaeota archaeon B63]|nr:MAG: haloacid dehalogenase [Candidatus Bathyarchaeota archaeon B63]
MKKIKAVLFDIEDTLYDSSLQMRMARLNAIRAMNEAGLPIDPEMGYKILEEIVKEYGPDYTKHFDRLLERLGLRWNPRVIAAGVVAYRETSQVYLKPFSDTVPTLIRLRDLGYRLGVVAEGRSVKEWQKLIQLGVDHIFHSVLISEDLGAEELSAEQFYEGTRRLNAEPEESVYVSSRLNRGILYANRAGLITVQVRRGDSFAEKPKAPEARPDYTIDRLSEILKILEFMR